MSATTPPRSGSGIRQLAAQTVVYGLSSLVGRLVNWALTPYYLYVFAPEQFGRFTDLYALSFYPLILLTFGLETAFFRYAGQHYNAREAYRHAWAVVLALAALFGVVAGLVLPSLAPELGYGRHPGLLFLLLLIILLDVAAALPLAHLRYQQQAWRFARISLLNVGVTVVLTVSLLELLGAEVKWALAANAAASALRLLLALWGNAPRLRRLNPAVARQLAGYGFWIMLAGLLGAINETIGRNLLPRLWPEGQVFAGQPRSGMEMNGLYAATYKLAVIIQLGLQAFRYAAEPYFFRQQEGPAARAAFARLMHYFLVVCLLLVLVVGAFARDLVAFTWFGLLPRGLITPEYRAGLAALPLLLFAFTAFGVYIQLSMWFKRSGQVRYGLLFAAVGACITLVANVLLIPTFGMLGSAFATLCCYTIMSVLAYYTGQALAPVPYRWGAVAVYLAAVAAILSLNALLREASWGMLGRILLVGGLAVLILGLEWRRFRQFRQRSQQQPAPAAQEADSKSGAA